MKLTTALRISLLIGVSLIYVSVGVASNILASMLLGEGNDGSLEEGQN